MNVRDTCLACGVEIPKGRQFCPNCETWSAAPDGFLPDGTPLYLKTSKSQPYPNLQSELYDMLMNYRRNVDKDD